MFDLQVAPPGPPAGPQTPHGLPLHPHTLPTATVADPAAGREVLSVRLVATMVETAKVGAQVPGLLLVVCHPSLCVTFSNTI